MAGKHRHNYVFVSSHFITRGGKRYVVRIYRCSCGDERFTEDPA